MSLIHCAAQNNHQDVLQFIHDSLDRYNINTLEKVRFPACSILWDNASWIKSDCKTSSGRQPEFQIFSCIRQRFSTCGPRTTGGPRPSAWWSASIAWYFSLFTINLTIGIKNRRNLFVFAYVSHCMTNMLFSNFIFISFGRNSKTLTNVKSTLDSPQIFDCRSKFLIDSRFWWGWLSVVYQFIVGLF